MIKRQQTIALRWPRVLSLVAAMALAFVTGDDGTRFPQGGLKSTLRAAEAPGPAVLQLTLLRRDEPDGPPRTEVVAVDPRRVAVVMVDTWNFHWCLTAASRCGSYVERFNVALEGCRALGMPVFWCPTDVADHYVGTPQRETAIAVPRVELPPSLEIPFRTIETYDSNGCMCGPGIKCRHNYGWDAIHPGLKVLPEDLMPEGTQELYSVCRGRGITHLIYMGFHTNVCTTGKPVGIRAMADAGLQCILARDMTDAITGYDPATGHHPDQQTIDVVAQIETQVPTIHMIDELAEEGLWPVDRPVDPVRVAPWGTPERPYLFEESTVVTLSAPLTPGASLRYTTDGTSPNAGSPEYANPFVVDQTTTLRTAGFDSAGRTICLETVALLVRLPPRPPLPDLPLVDLTPLRATCSGFHAYGSRKQPVLNRSYSGGEIVLRGESYAAGIGVDAPSQLLYAILPEYRRFVGRAGVDEGIVADDLGRAVAMYPSVVFRVYIDGRLAAESPPMRIQHEPWRFDVEIPSGSRAISLVAADGGNGNRHDLADWIEAGFVLE